MPPFGGSIDSENKFRAPLNNIVDPKIAIIQSYYNSGMDLNPVIPINQKFVKDIELKKMKDRTSASAKSIKR